MFFNGNNRASNSEKLNGLYSILIGFSNLHPQEIKERMRSFGIELGMSSLAIEESLTSHIDVTELKHRLKGDKFWYILSVVRMADKPNTKSDYKYFVNVANGIGLSVSQVDKAIKQEASSLNKLKNVIILSS
jgi:hypothetical protein